MEKEELHKKLDNFLVVITKRVWMGNYFRYWSAWMSAGKKLVLPTKNVCGNMFATH